MVFPSSNRLFASFSGVALATIVAGAPTALAQEADPSEQAISDAQYLRVVDEAGKQLTLQVGTRTFTRPGHDGPVVALVGVAHIGDASLYRDLQRQLDSYDVVLYESVKPAGAGEPRGATPASRVEATKASLGFLEQAIGLYTERVDSLPASKADLIVGLQTLDPRLAQWADEAWTDAWGATIDYDVDEASDSFALRSLGADGSVGGEGPDADIVVTGDRSSKPLALSSDDNLQAQLAATLGLAFQLEAIDYGGEDWVCSDMTLDQLSRAFEQKGLDFGQLNSTLAGSSLPASLLKIGLRLIRVLDVMMEGMFSDMAKVFMIEMLGNESIFEGALEQQFGAGFAEVIIEQRNQVVLDDLKSLLSERPEVESVAIFYGAGHMPDLEDRLTEQLGYERAGVTWTPAIAVDLEKSQMSSRDVKMIRDRIRMMLRTMR